MSHANAALTPRARLRLARLIVDDGWSPSVAAKMFMVSTVTARKWAARFRAEGVSGMQDRSSRPRSMPAKTPVSVVKRIVKVRWRRRLGPVQIAGELGLAPSTVHAVLVHCRINRLSRIDRVTGEPIRRCEHDHPGSLIHVDVKKLGRIPDGGGWRAHGRSEKVRGRGIGYDYVHTVIDDYSRVAYAEIHDDEKGITAAGVLERAIAFYATLGIKVERVISDNAFAYRKSAAFRRVIDAHHIKQKFIKPHCPWTNGKVERLNRTLATEWAYARPFISNAERRAALPSWLNYYNLDRAHLGIGGKTPIDRINNGRGQYI